MTTFHNLHLCAFMTFCLLCSGVWAQTTSEDNGTYQAFLFEETFSNTEMGKDSDGSSFDFQTAKSSKESSGDKFADNQGWTFENGYQSVKCVKIGKATGTTASDIGKATTPKLGKAGNLILTFNAGAWMGHKTDNGLKLSVNGGGTLSQSVFTLKNAAWETYTVLITGATTATTITFSNVQAGKNCFFLDNVIVKAEMPVTDDNTDVLNNGTTTKVLEDEEDGQSVYYMTYVTKFDVDMRNSKDVDAYVVTGLNENESALAMQKVNFIPAKTALLLKVTQNEEFAMYKSPMSITADEALNSNLLHAGQGEVVGEDEGVRDAYGLGIVGGKAGFYRIQNGVKIPENKAYLLLADYGVNDTKAFYGFHGDGETMAIGQTADGGTDGVSVYYNVQGQQVKNPIHGIYIVNGKKIWIK